MKTLFFILILLISLGVKSQCTDYLIYESFSSVLPTQGGTWTSNSMVASTTSIRTGTHCLAFNGANDWVRTPKITNPGVLSFWYRRSSNSTAWTLNIQTSPDGTTWTTRGSITTVTTTYQQYTLNIGTLGLTNVFIRMIDARSSGAHERYIDDLSLTSTLSTENLLFPFLGSCSKTLNNGSILNVSDDGGPVGPLLGGHSNNVNRTLTITPSDNTKQVTLSFFQMDLETGYDSLYVYDGSNTSATRILSAGGTTLPSSVTASNANGQLTIQWKTDVSNVGVWGGFLIEASIITPLPVELLYFEGMPYPTFNKLIWSTASEHNSDYFQIERSVDGETWKTVGIKSASGNSTIKIDYSHLDSFDEFVVYYYILKQVDYDGQYKIYGPISLDNTKSFKKVVKYVNLLGQEVNFYTKGLLIEVYEDGTMKKIIR